MNYSSLLVLTKYSLKGASSRYRSLQYLPFINAAGFKTTASPLFSDAYLDNKYQKGRASLQHVANAFFRRLWAVLKAPKGCPIFLEYEVFPYFPAWFEIFLKWRGCRVVVDYDDALFHQYDQHSNPIVRRLLGGKIAKVMRLSDTVIAGNEYLANYASNAGAKQVFVIPTVIDLNRYSLPLDLQKKHKFTIGWIGSPSTARYLQDIAEALARVCNKCAARVVLIGSGPVNMPNVNLEVMPWLENTEVSMMQQFDVGIMPLPDEPWAKGKCGFKLIQYMACGLPVVASPVGVNTEIVQHGENGLLASSCEEWVKALVGLAQDKDKRLTMGVAGRKQVEHRYCLQVTAPRLVSILEHQSSSH